MPGVGIAAVILVHWDRGYAGIDVSYVKNKSYDGLKVGGVLNGTVTRNSGDTFDVTNEQFLTKAQPQRYARYSTWTQDVYTWTCSASSLTSRPYTWTSKRSKVGQLTRQPAVRSCRYTRSEPGARRFPEQPARAALPVT
jgi:hypothetical protein